MKKLQVLKDAALALSLANLCFIRTWAELLDSSGPEYFRIQNFNRFLSVIINVIGLAVLLWIVANLVRFCRKPLLLNSGKWAFLMVVFIPLQLILFFVLVLPLSVIVWKLAEPSTVLRFLAFIIAMALAIASAVITKRWHRILIRPAVTVVLVLFPFCLMTMFQSFQSMTKFSDKALAPPLAEKRISATRVLWLLFDEMDQQIAFSQRPATLQLPELDRFRSQAIYASNVYPPADYTLISMPALITGNLVSKAQPINPAELMITFANSHDAVRWSTQPNVFSKAREAGFNTALIGEYLPYCRIIGDSLTECYWRDVGAITLRESLLDQVQSLINTVPIMSQLGISNRKKSKELFERQNQLNAYIDELEAAKKAAVDADLGLILVHWPVPHAPGIYNRQTRQFETAVQSSYLDNLQLVDRTLGEIRGVMEAAGTWDTTVVLVTSDHWLRPDVWEGMGYWTREDEDTLSGNRDHRIPFILKLAGQMHTVTYEPVFNNVLSHDLILSLLRGELSSPDSVVHWIDQHSSIGETPYVLNSTK